MQSQPNDDPRRMVKTRTPGIYKRGSRYVVVYRANGRQRRESARTLEEARRLKSARQADVARGEFHEASRLRFGDYAREWVERYHRRGRRGFRESSREDYRALLEHYAIPYLDGRLGRTLSAITPRDVANFVHWLSEQRGRSGRPLADDTIRKALNPLRACLASAVQEGLIRHNPTRRVSLPHRPNVEDDDGEDVRALTREQLATFLAVVHPRHRLLFRFLAATGLRVSEVLGLQWRHLRLDASSPHVKVRRTIVRGRLHPPKSKYGKRDVPLPADLVDALRARRRETEWPGDRDLVFPSLTGKSIHIDNLRNRHLRPAAQEAGAPWAGFHTFRHTCASLLFERGGNAVQVQRWLGHHSPAFTLATYVHLLDETLGEPLDLALELGGGNRVATDPTAQDGTADGALTDDLVA